MSITVHEKWDSRPAILGKNAQRELWYTIRGTTSDSAAHAALLDHAPEEYHGLVRDSAEVEPVAMEGSGGEPNVWEAIVYYGEVDPLAFKPPATGESVFNFDTGGGTQHITQSLGTVSSHSPPGKSVPHFGGAIGVSDAGVEGVDITVPVYTFSETHYMPAENVTEAYRSTLFFLTGRVNNAPFKGLDAGECLFLGASGSKRGEEDWEITFRFAGSPNRTGLVVGDISGINKAGWDYLWVLYENQEDASAQMLVKRPRAAYVERVYELGNFGALGIGT